MMLKKYCAQNGNKKLVFEKNAFGLFSFLIKSNGIGVEKSSNF